MSEAANTLTLNINGIPLTVTSGTTVAVAILVSKVHVRRSVTGEERGPLCGMGICFECRVTIDDTPHQRSCQILCANGMDVRTP